MVIQEVHGEGSEETSEDRLIDFSFESRVMDRTQVIIYKNIRIIYDDWSNLKTHDEMRRALERSLEVLQQQEIRNTYAITDVTNCYYDKELVQWLLEVATPINRQYVVANAVIGLSPLQSFIMKRVMMLSRRPFYVAKDLEEAKELLYQDRLRRETNR